MSAAATSLIINYCTCRLQLVREVNQQEVWTSLQRTGWVIISACLCFISLFVELSLCFKVLAFKLVRTTTSWQMARCRKAVKWSIKSQWTIDQLDKERWKKVAFYYYYIVQIMFYLMFYVRPFLFSMNSLTDLKYLRSIKFQWWICVCFVTILMVCNYLPHSLMALLFPSPNWLLAAAPPALVHSWHSLHKH